VITAGTHGKTFEVDVERRTIYGLAVPYNEPTFSDGDKFQFTRGVIELPSEPSRVKLRVSHAPGTDVGKATNFEETDEGLWVRFSVARGAKGDEALSMAEDGVWDGLSIGLRDGAKFSKKAGITKFSQAVLSEISLTPDPAFSSARVASVVAEAPNSKERPVEDETKDAVVAPAAFDMDAFVKAIGEHMPAPAVTNVINPTAQFAVKEASPYAFDAASQKFIAGQGEHDFSTDLINGLRNNDHEAYERAMTFVQEQFAVAQTNVTAGNYPQNKTDLYVARKDFRYPLWDAVKKGNLVNATPFLFPRYNSSNGLVQDHTEGVEPSPGGFSLTSQTVTPKAMSGKVELTREVWDMGGNPQVSNLIFTEMVRGWNEVLEASVSTELNAQAANITDVLLTTGAAGTALVNEVLAKFVGFQFERGGFRYDNMALQVDLFTKLATATDTAGRQVLPYLNPHNAAGQSGPRLQSLDIQGVAGYPAWALAASSANASNSWLFDSTAVHGWASTPQRLEFQYRVAFVDLAIWGYRAVAVSDVAGVRQFIYDPVV
jgi:HK97 family phage prohead protease